MNTQKRYKRISIDDRISNFVDASIECGYAGRDYLTRQEIENVCTTSGLVFPRWLAYNQGVDGGRQIGRAKFSFPELKEAGSGTIELVEPTSEFVEDATEVNEVPEEQLSVPVVTSNAIPTISAEDMLSLTSL
jgi:hypothetical protein